MIREVDLSGIFIDVSKQNAEGILAITGKERGHFHFALRHPDITDRTFGALYETRDQADAERKKLAGPKVKPALSILSYNYWQKWNLTPIIELKKGDYYEPCNTIGRGYTHGVNDGFHGSEIKYPEDKDKLAPK